MGSILHKKVSTIPDASASTKVRPSDWNDEHDFTLYRADVGLGNVDNTADADKPISNAVVIALDSKSSTSHNHTGIYDPIGTGAAAVVTHVGLTDPHTQYHNDSRAAAWHTGLGGGHISSGDQSKLNGIATGAEVNVNADWNSISGDSQILNKPTLPQDENGSANNFLTAYEITTGIFSKARPVWADIDKTTSSIADITTKSHTSLSDIGTNTHSGIDTHIGATSDPHGSTQIITVGLKVPKIYPSADSVAAFQVNKADGLTVIFNVDSTNSRFGINTASPLRSLDLSATGQITFGDGVTTDSSAGIYWYSSTNYGIYRTPGTWIAPDYQQLQIWWDTGIILHGGSTSGKSGVQIQNNDEGTVGIRMAPPLSIDGILGINANMNSAGRIIFTNSNSGISAYAEFAVRNTADTGSGVINNAIRFLVTGKSFSLTSGMYMANTGSLSTGSGMDQLNIGTIKSDAPINFFIGGYVESCKRITILGNNLGIGTATPTNTISLGGNVARAIWMERRTTAGVGYALTIQPGGVKSGETDTAGGDLILQPGVSTGSSESGVQIKGCVAGASGSTDRTMSTMLQILGDKWALNGVAASKTQTGWTTSNVTSRRIVDADAVTLAELADAVCTLIEDFKTKGALAA